MELIIGRTALLNGLNLAQGIVERRNTVPILGNVLIDATASSMDWRRPIWKSGCGPSWLANAGQPGTVTLNAHKLFEIVRETVADEVSLRSLENDWVEIKCGRAQFQNDESGSAQLSGDANFRRSGRERQSPVSPRAELTSEPSSLPP